MGLEALSPFPKKVTPDSWLILTLTHDPNLILSVCWDSVRLGFSLVTLALKASKGLYEHEIDNKIR